MSASALPELDTSWMADGACRGKTALFFPNGGGEVSTEVRAVCASCPVRRPCGDYADATDPEGVWAGLSQRERRRAKQGRGAA